MPRTQGLDPTLVGASVLACKILGAISWTLLTGLASQQGQPVLRPGSCVHNSNQCEQSPIYLTNSD